MITKDSVETAYCFFHQKHRIYQHSTLDWQKDDIEFAIGEYTDCMSAELYEKLSAGRHDFLRNHKTFFDDLSAAVNDLEDLLNCF
ncbi:MAG: hypothetical protein E7076_07400 [Bacteroidales bacterium]|jgi:hypothetical protein|nr:hypothetical protein [Bacteroidales bacterium]MBP5135193.1 hypothetical protein [Paludibacteraceae bacterium]MDD6356724.1 hypothetical protein [Bacteroidales bacterium]